MKRLIEIRPAEGGEDARLLVLDLAGAYEALCKRRG
jgi:protein subunit release factor A